MADLIGQRIGQYDVTALLGEGGMATVYRARQISIKRDVAIKVIEARWARNADLIKRFTREAETVAALSHPHILKIFDYGTHDKDLFYLVMELLSGGSLANRIREKPLTFEMAARLFEQVAGAIDYAHEVGVIHRDLKPQNILLDARENAVLTDFGIAKILSETTSFTQSGAIMGTPAYMSPEQWQGKPVDARTDIYALGAILFEMLTGRVPFEADTPYAMMHAHINERPPAARMIRADIDPAIDAVLDQALAKHPNERFQSASAMSEAFKAALGGLTPIRPPRAVTVPLIAPRSPIDDLPTIIPESESTPATQPPQSTAALRRIGRPPRWLRAIGGAAIAVLLLLGAYFASRSLVNLIRAGRATPTRPTATQLIALVPSQPAATLLPTNVPLSVVTVPTATEIAQTNVNPSTATGTSASTISANKQWTPQIQTFNGVVMVLVPAGCFDMGSASGDSDERPVAQLCFSEPFWIDRFEVTNSQFAGFNGRAKEATAWTQPNYPRTNVTWYEARDFCALRKGRLPNEAEWEYAGRGPSGLVYPWGDTLTPSYTVFKDNSGGQPVDVGSRPLGMAWVGALDMSGNVSEWQSSRYDPYPYVMNDGRDDLTGKAELRVVRGGSWYDEASALRLAHRNGLDPAQGYGDVGFRCVRAYR